MDAASTTRHPFPGLRPFEAADADLFFGREGQAEALLRLLRRSRLLALVGTSGSGKSSLVRAGLVPYLKGGQLADAGAAWRVATLRPGEDPIGALARALDPPEVLGKAPHSDEDAARDATLLEVRLKRSGLGLIEVVRLARLEAGQNLLIVVDQFEELFRFAALAQNQRDAAAFVKLLLEATRQSALPIYVVLTMRSDFIGDCSRFRDLPEAVTNGLFLIPRLTREQRRAAIEQPVRAAGATISQRLVNRVLNDVGDDPDQLPVMQHALMRTWDHWQARVEGQAADTANAASLAGVPPPLDLEDYNAIGRTAEALSNHAEDAYAALDDDGQRIARRMFQCLTEKGADNREVRRAVPLGTLGEVVGASLTDLTGVIEEFRKPQRSFLMPPAGVALTPRSLVDIAHESLIRHWRRLAGWVEEEAESAKSYRHLAETAALHTRGRAGLWGALDLSDYDEWNGRLQPTPAWAERYHAGFATAMAFLEESRQARDASRRARRRLWIAAAAAIILAIVGLSGLTTFALIAKNDALRKEKEATEARNDAVRKEQEASEARQDVAQVARLSRQALADVQRGEASDLTDVKNFAPPSWSPYLYRRLAISHIKAGEFAAAREQLTSAMAARPGFLPDLVTSSDLYLVVGNADAAARDARAYVDVYNNNPAAYGNLIIAEAMRRNYDQALRDIDAARANLLFPIDISESIVPPDLKPLTYNFVLSIADSDFLLALGYVQAFLHAMQGDPRFAAALEDNDRQDLDFPYSRESYLLALDWAWLIIRSQSAADNGPGAPPPEAEIRDYGAYAAEGAMWERVARTRPAYRISAERAYGKFQAAYRRQPEPRYADLALWVEGRMAQPASPVAREESELERARDLAMEADDMKRLATSSSQFVETAQAHAKLSEAIGVLEARRQARRIGRREQDLLNRLLLRRAEWRGTDDKSGAQEDARNVIASNPKIPDAYMALASATFDPAVRKESEGKAIMLDPLAPAHLQAAARARQRDDPKGALDLMRQRARMVTQWSRDYRFVAQLHASLHDYPETLRNTDLAIAHAPWDSTIYDERRNYEIQSGVDGNVAIVHFVRSLRSLAEFQARTGNDASAMRIYVRAFMRVSAVPAAVDGRTTELEAVVRDFSGFLVARYGREAAVRFWKSLAGDPLLASAQQQMAEAQAASLSQPSR